MLGVVVLGAGDGLDRVELLERLADDGECLVEILLADHEWGREADDVDVRRLRGVANELADPLRRDLVG